MSEGRCAGCPAGPSTPRRGPQAARHRQRPAGPSTYVPAASVRARRAPRAPTRAQNRRGALGSLHGCSACRAYPHSAASLRLLSSPAPGGALPLVLTRGRLSGSLPRGASWRAQLRWIAAGVADTVHCISAFCGCTRALLARFAGLRRRAAAPPPPQRFHRLDKCAASLHAAVRPRHSEQQLAARAVGQLPSCSVWPSSRIA